MKKSILATILISLVAFASIASATSITLTETGVNNAVTINGTFGGSINATTNVSAGYVQVSINGAGSINAFCVDPAWASSSPQAYDLRAIDPNSSYAKAAYLFSQSNTGNAAAVQIAIWETVLGNSFTWNNPTQTLLDKVTALTATVNNPLPSTFHLSSYSLAVSPGNVPSGFGVGYQDFIVNVPSGGAPVPEPSTFLLFGAGLVGVGFLKRKIRA